MLYSQRLYHHNQHQPDAVYCWAPTRAQSLILLAQLPIAAFTKSSVQLSTGHPTVRLPVPTCSTHLHQNSSNISLPITTPYFYQLLDRLIWSTTVRAMMDRRSVSKVMRLVLGCQVPYCWVVFMTMMFDGFSVEWDCVSLVTLYTTQYYVGIFVFFTICWVYYRIIFVDLWYVLQS